MGTFSTSATATPAPEPTTVHEPTIVAASASAPTTGAAPTPAPASTPRPDTEPLGFMSLSPEGQRVQVLTTSIALYNRMLHDRDRQGHPRSSADSVGLIDRIYNTERQLYEAIRVNPPRTEQVNTPVAEPPRPRRVTFAELPRRF